ncbi:acetoacetate--CoA ligase [Ideonella sp. DXS29W]|uniref:Acetoacetate--CoA ligase n=1 Tax=Ideonella lacteola TaxID=2984193 RepID=A0ABU9BN65_9BURK
MTTLTLPTPRITVFQRWLAQRQGLHFSRYEDLWQWSVNDLNAFWRAIWEFFDIESPTPFEAVLADARLPGARWFPGAQLNYARQVLRHGQSAHAAGHPAIVWADEPALNAGTLQTLSWPDLAAQVGHLAAAFRRLGVARGDRVAAVLPNRPETVVAFLAAASIGAVWSVCSPDMGPVAVLDRFRQIEPTLLLAADGYRFGGVAHDRRTLVGQLLHGLPTLRHVVDVNVLGLAPDTAPTTVARHAFDALTRPAGESTSTAMIDPEWLPFDHPLWIVYSSGTTGLPKPIVHGHGGIVLEALKGGTLHNNLGASIDTGDRFFWYSSTGWIMWNCQIGGLLGGTTICLYDGSPAASRSGPADWSPLWRFASLARCTFFGAGAAFYASCLKADVRPQALGELSDLGALRAVGSTGSPLSDDCYRWIWEHLPRVNDRDIWIACISGGTDFAGAFVAGLPTLPLVAGEMQCRCLGAKVEAWSEPEESSAPRAEPGSSPSPHGGLGRPLMNEVGELVCTAPMPSMPLYLWGDTTGERLRQSYFDVYPGVWRHGDWIRLVPHEDAVGAVIYGRSDATINRHGVRMGTAELYRAVEAVPEVLDSLVVDLEYLGRESYMPLFVVLREGAVLDDALKKQLVDAIRQALSPRHVPSEIIAVPAVPRTLSGKKMELPIKRLLMGADPARVMNRDAMANASSVDWFIDFAARRQAVSGRQH